MYVLFQLSMVIFVIIDNTDVIQANDNVVVVAALTFPSLWDAIRKPLLSYVLKPY